LSDDRFECDRLNWLPAISIHAAIPFVARA